MNIVTKVLAVLGVVVVASTFYFYPAKAQEVTPPGCLTYEGVYSLLVQDIAGVKVQKHIVLPDEITAFKKHLSEVTGTPIVGFTFEQVLVLENPDDQVNYFVVLFGPDGCKGAEFWQDRKDFDNMMELVFGVEVKN